MSYDLLTIFSFSIAIAAIIGLIRFKKINPAYYPFLFCIWLAFLNEILNYILARTIKNNIPNNNIYVLLESLLITWQFKRWGLFQRTNYLYFLLISLYVTAWVIEIFFVFTINQMTFYFQIFYSFIVVLMSIHIINRLIVRERKNVLKNPVFLICLAFVTYFTLRVLILTFQLYGTNLSREFRVNVFYSMIYVNLLSNLIYALAVLWMPTKQRFTMPS